METLLAVFIYHHIRNVGYVKQLISLLTSVLGVSRVINLYITYRVAFRLTKKFNLESHITLPS